MGLRFGLGLGFWADVAGSSRPKSGMTIETPPMVMVTGCSLAVGGFVGAGLITGRGLIVLAVGGVRVFTTDDARSFCWRFRGSNLSLFPISRPISKYVASGVGSLGREGVFRALSISFSSSSSSSSSRGGTKITFLSLPLFSLKVYPNWHLALPPLHLLFACSTRSPNLTFAPSWETLGWARRSRSRSAGTTVAQQG